MGFSTFSITTSEPKMTYSATPIQGSWSYYDVTSGSPILVTYNQVWQYRRHCTWSIKVVGCDYDRAKAKVDEYISQFTRTVYDYVWNQVSGDFTKEVVGQKLMAAISTSHNGHLYEINVQIKEDDIALDKDCADPASQFALLNTSRGYK